MRHDSGEGRIVATFYDLRSEIWSASPVAQSIEIGLEAVESLNYLQTRIQIHFKGPSKKMIM